MNSLRIPKRDPEGAHARETIAARRVGLNAKCACGEKRPRTLVKGSKPRVCFACQRKKNGRTIMDNHHPAGEANSPITIPVPVNDHRAVLSVAQYDWPKQTLENPYGSPLRAAAASVRGFVDTALYLIKKGLLWVADLLEKLDVHLELTGGPKWWIGTSVEQFAPKR